MFIQTMIPVDLLFTIDTGEDQTIASKNKFKIQDINVFYFVPFILVKSLILAQDERWRRG